MDLSPFEDDFAHSVRSAGAEFFRLAHLEIVNSKPHALFAKALGDKKYDIHVRYTSENSRLSCQCSCPHFALGHLCKHVWATFLAANEVEWFDRNEGLSSAHSVVWQEPKDEQDDENDAEDFEPNKGFSVLKAAWRHDLVTLCSRPDAEVGRATARVHEQFFVCCNGFSAEALILKFGSQKFLKSGKGGRIKDLQLGKYAFENFSDLDLELAHFAFDCASSGLTYTPQRVSTMRVGLTQLEHTVRLFATQQRLVASFTSEVLRPMLWQADEPIATHLAVEPSRSDWYALHCTFVHSNGNRRRLAEAIGVCGRFVFFRDVIWKVDDNQDAHFIANLHRSGGQFDFPKHAAEEVLENIVKLPAGAALSLPDDLQWERISIAPHFAVVLSRKFEVDGMWPVKVECRYRDKIFYLPSSGVVIPDALSHALYLRDLGGETQFLESLQQIGLKKERSGFYHQKGFLWQLPRENVAALVELCTTLEASIFLDEKKASTLSKPRFRVVSSVDWFDLEVETKEKIDLAALIDGAKSGWIELKDGSVAVVPRSLERRLARFAAVSEKQDQGFRFQSNQALIIDALLLSIDDNVDFDPPFFSVREKLNTYANMKPSEAPDGFVGTLRPYQKEGLNWLLTLDRLKLGGILADDMGLGKTIQVLAFLQSLKNKKEGLTNPVLIVVPRSLIANWQLEAQRFAPNLSVLDYANANRLSSRGKFSGYDLILTTYAMLRSDIEFLAKQQFSYVILDEAQNIKNSSAQISKAARLLKTQGRLALTGTPVENSLNDLYSLLHFLNPGFVKNSGTLATLSETEDASQSASLMQLSKVLRPILLRRTKEAVLTDLPPKVEEVLCNDLSETEQAAYAKIRDEYKATVTTEIDAAGMGRAKIHVLEAILRLRQLACHPALAFKERWKDASSSKVDLLIEKLEEIIAAGHKALVFSSFSSLLELVSTQLEKEKINHVILTGATKNRQECVDTFQNSLSTSVFLLSLKAGGTGLNLTAADYCFILDPWWNPAAEAQAIDRAHRIGQTKTVFSYRMISRGTIEEKILKLQEKKRSLSDAILRQDESFISALTSEDIDYLLT